MKSFKNEILLKIETCQMKSYRIKIMSVFIAFIDHCDLIFLETDTCTDINSLLTKLKKTLSLIFPNLLQEIFR